MIVEMVIIVTNHPHKNGGFVICPLPKSFMHNLCKTFSDDAVNKLSQYGGEKGNNWLANQTHLPWIKTECPDT